MRWRPNNGIMVVSFSAPGLGADRMSGIVQTRAWEVGTFGERLQTAAPVDTDSIGAVQMHPMATRSMRTCYLP